MILVSDKLVLSKSTVSIVENSKLAHFSKLAKECTATTSDNYYHHHHHDLANNLIYPFHELRVQSIEGKARLVLIRSNSSPCVQEIMRHYSFK